MAGIEGLQSYDDTIDNTTKNEALSDLESQKNNETNETDTKSDLDNLKKQIESKNTQTNIKIEETIDIFEEQSNTKLTDNQKLEVTNLLSEALKKVSSPNDFFSSVIDKIKIYGNEVVYEDISDIVGEFTLKQEKKSEDQEKKSEDQEKKSEDQEKKSEKQEKNIELEKLSNLSNSLNGLDKSNEKYGSIVNNVNKLLTLEFNSEEYKNLYEKTINELKNQDTLEAVADDLRKQSPEKYESFKNSLSSIDGSFREKFDLYETKFSKAADMVALGTNTTEGIEKIGNKTIQKFDGMNTELQNGERNLSIQDSPYKLESNLQNETVVQEIEDKKQEFTNFMKGINEELNTLSSIIDFIDQAIYDNLDITEAKQQIKTTNPDAYREYNLDSYTNLQEMKNALNGVYKQKEEEKDLLVKGAKKVISDILEKNAQNAKEKDKQVKETLAFLKSIGFDKIPQSITDNIISQLNSNTGLRNMLGLSSKIDLKNGILGTNADNDFGSIANQEKVNFAKIFNIMLTGKADNGPINVYAIQNDTGNPISNMSNFEVFINENKLNNSGIVSALIYKNIKSYIKDQNK